MMTAPTCFVSWLAVTVVVLAASVTTGGHAAERRVPGSAGEVQLSYAPLVREVAPGVVNIYTRRVVRQRQSPFPFDDPFFERFFGERLFGMPRERVQNSLGSGVIVEAGGLIVTNHHVVEGSDEITVALADRREFAATLVGTDERTDLALLRIDSAPETLPFLELGDSDRLQVGDLVLAIGNPFGVGQTVTSGIVSALARTGVGVSDVGSFIQTDAAINPGNSGGALVTLDGKVVGINTAIFSRSGGSIGIGFAIPSNLVRVVIDAIAAGGRAVRPWFGVGGQAATQDLAESLGLDRPLGVLINEIHPLSPAGRAGLRIGDVVTAIDAHEVFDPQGLRYRIATRPIGDTVTLAVVRDGATLTLSVPLIAPPEHPPRDIRSLGGRHPMTGAAVANLSPAFAEELNIDSNKTGVIVLEVKGGPAARLGLKPGDIVVRVGETVIDTTESLVAALERSRAEWRIVINRGGETMSVVVRG
jgi:serine protease Do